MKLRGALPVFVLMSLLALVLAGCDNGPAPVAPTPTGTPVVGQSQGETDVAATRTAGTGTGAEPTLAVAEESTVVMPAEGTVATPTGTIVDVATIAGPTAADVVPTATPVTATSTGEEMTALQALAELKEMALEEMPDAQLAMLVNSRPGQQKILLGTSLGDPNVNEATPGGLGRNWTLVAVSPSQKRAVAFSTDGSVVDMTKEGAVPDELLANFGPATGGALGLSTLDAASLTDSDAVAKSAGERGGGEQVGIALLAPEALGMGALPTPETGGPSPQLAYELFSTDAATQLFVIFDARTGEVVLDSGT